MICEHLNSDCLDSRPTTGINQLPVKFPQAIRRRRRKCKDCGELFTTYEVTDDDLRAVFQQITADANKKHRLLKDAFLQIKDTLEQFNV